MTYGGNAYGSAPYGSSAPSTGGTSTVSLAPAVVDLVAPTLGVKVGVRVDLQPAVVDLVAPTVTPAVYDDEYAAAVLADSPLIYWRLGESSGTTAVDSSGNGHDGTYQNSPTLGAAGALNVGSDAAVTFTQPGTEHVSVADDAAFDSADYSVEFWFKTSTDNQQIVLRSNAWGASLLSGGIQAISYNDANLSTPSGTFNDDAWHHVVIVHDYSGTGVATLYVDGSSVSTDSSLTTSNNSASSSAITIANNGGVGGFTGTLDEFAYYTSALSAARVQAHYDAATGPVTVSLQPAVVDVVAPTVTVSLAEISIDLQPAVLDLVAPVIASPSNPVSVGLEPAVLELVAPRIPRRLLVTPWTLDDWGSTAFGVEIQQEPVLRWGDPVAESGWRPIRTNRITWASLAVDPSTGRPRTPTTVTVALKPAVLELAAPALQF